MTEKNTVAGSGDPKSLSLDELIRIELLGKKAAMGRYDGILWQIRSGYMVVLFATLGLLVGREKPFELSGYTVTVVCWFSLIALLVDFAFRRNQLRVVRAYDQLADIVIDKTTGKEISIAGVRQFLHISGEDSKIRIPLRDIVLPAVLIYAGTAVIVILLWIAQSWSTHSK